MIRAIKSQLYTIFKGLEDVRETQSTLICGGRQDGVRVREGRGFCFAPSTAKLLCIFQLTYSCIPCITLEHTKNLPLVL